MTRARRLLRRFLRAEDGSGTLEFAVLAPVFLGLFLSTFELGMLLARQMMLDRGIDLAVRDWSRRDASVARRLRRVDNARMAYLRTLIGALHPDPDDVEARSLLTFSLAIGDHFIAADHGARSREDVLQLAVQRLFAR